MIHDSIIGPREPGGKPKLMDSKTGNFASTATRQLENVIIMETRFQRRGRLFDQGAHIIEPCRAGLIAGLHKDHHELA